MITKAHFYAKFSSCNRKITANKAKNLLAENDLNKLKTYDSRYFVGKSHFEEGGTQSYLVFQPINRYFKVIANTDYFSSWKSKGLSAESIKPPIHSDTSLSPAVSYYGTKMRVKFTGSCLKQPKISYTHGNVINISIVYEFGASITYNNDPTLKNCFFGAVTLAKNADIDKYGYSSYGTGFDRKSSFSFRISGFGKNAIIFVVDMSSSAHIDDKKKYILILEKGPTQKLEHTLTAEKMYLINFTVKNNKFCLGLHYNGANSYLFVNGTEIYNIKAKDSEIVATPLCLGNISKDWSVDNMKKNRV